MHTLITHIIYMRRPAKGYTQVIPICSSEEEVEKGRYFLGYDGSVPLSDRDLVSDTANKISKLPNPVQILSDNYLWLDSHGEIFYGNHDARELQHIGHI
jgi:hypothetical protein